MDVNDGRAAVVLGRILGAFGIHGWIRIKPFTESFDGLMEQRVWTLQQRGHDRGDASNRDQPRDGRQVRVEECKPHGAFLLAKVEGVADRTEAEALRGADVTVAREKLPAAEEGEYYWNDLVGLRVRNVRGVELGIITGLIAAPAHDVLRVRRVGGSGSEGGARDVRTAGHEAGSGSEGANGNEGDVASEGDHEQLIPFVEPILREVDVAGGFVIVDWEADY